MQVILPHVFFVELVRTLAEVSSEILHSVEVTLNGERRVITTLELLQHPLS
jgi:hypothetical protein